MPQLEELYCCDDFRKSPVDLYHYSSPPFTNWIIGNGLLREYFVVLDIGCQGGEHPRWGLLGDRLAFYGFDPIREVVEKMRAERRPRRTYFDLALGDEDGARKATGICCWPSVMRSWARRIPLLTPSIIPGRGR